MELVGECSQLSGLWSRLILHFDLGLDLISNQLRISNVDFVFVNEKDRQFRRKFGFILKLKFFGL